MIITYHECLQSDVRARPENWHVYTAITEMSRFNRRHGGMIGGFIISTNHVSVKYYMYGIIKTTIYTLSPASDAVLLSCFAAIKRNLSIYVARFN